MISNPTVDGKILSVKLIVKVNTKIIKYDRNIKYMNR